MRERRKRVIMRERRKRVSYVALSLCAPGYDYKIQEMSNRYNSAYNCRVSLHHQKLPDGALVIIYKH